MAAPLSASPPITQAHITDPRQRRSILVAVCLALMAVIASVSGLNVAQPDLATTFDASQTQVLWFINIYTLTLAALLLPVGALGDRWGRKPMLLCGLLVFGAAGALAGLAWSSEAMLAARLLSGIGAVMIMPITLAVITSTFPEEERAKAIGIWTGVAGGGGILGMYLSAVLVDLASWRWLFLLPIILVAVAGLMTLRSVPNSLEHTAEPFDLVGSIASMIAMVGVVFAIHEGPDRGWTAPETLLSLAIGLVSGLGFVAWELRSHAPLLDVRQFRDRRLTSGSVSLLTVFGVQAGVFVVIFPFFQVVLGWSGLRSTLALMPMALLMMLASGLAPRVTARTGRKLVMCAGILLGGIGLASMAILASTDGGYRAILPGMLAMGFGMGFSMTPATDAITAALPRERQGVASALNDVTRELGTALGVGLLGAVLSAGYRQRIDGHLAGLAPDIAATAREGVATAVASSDGAGAAQPALILAAQEAFVGGWQQAMWVGVMVMALLLIFILLRGPSPIPTPASQRPRIEGPAN